MAQNAGVLDSVLRVMFGFALLFAAFIVAPPLKWFAYAGFLALAVTGFVGNCPLYSILGIRTFGRRDPSRGTGPAAG